MHTNDTLPALPPDQIQAFHHHLNSIKPPIQFMIEEESQGTILFLDTMVTRHDNGFLSHHRVLQEDSHRPLSELFHPTTLLHTRLQLHAPCSPDKICCFQQDKDVDKEHFCKSWRPAATPKPCSTNTGEHSHPHSTSQQDMPRATIVPTTLIYQIPCGTCGRA